MNWTVWGGLSILIAVLAGAFVWDQSQADSQSQTPTPAPSDPWAALSPVPSFQLTNQLGETVGLDAMLGKVWIADIIFTRCPGPCALMSKRMKELQGVFDESGPVKLVSLTTDPEYDSPDILADYARRVGADPSRWQFLTGSKSEIRKLAVEGLRLASMEKPEASRESANDLWIHSTLFVVVDQTGHLRGVFESVPRDVPGEQPDAEVWFQEVKSRILTLVESLVKTP